jgi:hypothetical protein
MPGPGLPSLSPARTEHGTRQYSTQLTTGAREPDAAMGDLGDVKLSSLPQAQLQAAESALHPAACPRTHRKLLCKVQTSHKLKGITLQCCP